MTGSVISYRGLRKVYGQTVAIENLDGSIRPGAVTGFLGPNGAGKSTALRCLLGLATPTAGEALIDGLRYDGLERPGHMIGAVLDSRGFHPSLTGEQSLRVAAIANDVPNSRVAEVLTQVGLDDAADRKVKGYSLGMRQRLSLAAALLADPGTLVLDEPANGLDPQAIVWLRNLLRTLAAEGRTILISSHQLAEMEHTVDDVFIIDRGVTKAQGSKAEVCGGRSLEETFLALTEGMLR